MLSNPVHVSGGVSPSQVIGFPLAHFHYIRRTTTLAGRKCITIWGKISAAKTVHDCKAICRTGRQAQRLLPIRVAQAVPKFKDSASAAPQSGGRELLQRLWAWKTLFGLLQGTQKGAWSSVCRSAAAGPLAAAELPAAAGLPAGRVGGGAPPVGGGLQSPLRQAHGTTTGGAGAHGACGTATAWGSAPRADWCPVQRQAPGGALPKRRLQGSLRQGDWATQPAASIRTGAWGSKPGVMLLQNFYGSPYELSPSPDPRGSYSPCCELHHVLQTPSGLTRDRCTPLQRTEIPGKLEASEEWWTWAEVSWSCKELFISSNHTFNFGSRDNMNLSTPSSILGNCGCCASWHESTFLHKGWITHNMVKSI